MKYEKPEAKMFKFDIEDVITASSFSPITTTTTTTISQTLTTPSDFSKDEEMWM